MADDFESFSKKMDVAAENLQTGGANMLRAMALQADRNLVIGTPVLSGLYPQSGK